MEMLRRDFMKSIAGLVMLSNLSHSVEAEQKCSGYHTNKPDPNPCNEICMCGNPVYIASGPISYSQFYDNISGEIASGGLRKFRIC
jgi:hypothetical protein